jgi:hypothetical protein
MKIHPLGDSRCAGSAESRVRAMTTTELELEIDEETERVLLWREEELERVGYGREIARDLAERMYVDLHFAMDLVRRGCPPDTALRILL